MTTLWLFDRRQTQLEPEGTQNAVDRCLGWVVARIDGSQQVWTLHADLRGEFLDSRGAHDFAESILQRRYPAVTAGRRACPPGDCGGIYGYYHFLEVRADPTHSEYEELVEWCGLDFQPERFDAAEINRAIHGG